MESLQEALDGLFATATLDETGKDYLDDEEYARTLTRKGIIQQLIDKEAEFNSRKDKIVKGSLWKCVVELREMPYDGDISGTDYWVRVGEKVEIRAIYPDGIYLERIDTRENRSNNDIYRYVDQFIYHFEPISDIKEYEERKHFVEREPDDDDYDEPREERVATLVKIMKQMNREEQEGISNLLKKHFK